MTSSAPWISLTALLYQLGNTPSPNARGLEFGGGTAQRAISHKLTPLMNDDSGVWAGGIGCRGGAALADAYSHTWSALYPYLSDVAAAPERRLQLALEDVRAVDADVVALQEVRARVAVRGSDGFNN